VSSYFLRIALDESPAGFPRIEPTETGGHHEARYQLFLTCSDSSPSQIVMSYLIRFD
jgi:hypothetical protein